MSVAPIDNPIFVSRPLDVDRVIVPFPVNGSARRDVVPAPKPFDAPPGVVPFHRMLEAENLARVPTRVVAPDIGVHRRADTFERDSSVRLLPTLGEVLPIVPIRIAPVEVQTTVRVQLPATGRLLDVYL